MRRPDPGNCAFCKSKLSEIIYYLMFGACTEEGSYKENDWDVFMNIGKHSVGGPDDVDVELVCEPNAVQKDLSFCSAQCMRRFFEAAFDKLM